MSKLQAQLLEMAKSLQEGQSITVEKGEEEQAFDDLISEGYVDAKKMETVGEDQVEYVDVIVLKG